MLTRETGPFGVRGQTLSAGPEPLVEEVDVDGPVRVKVGAGRAKVEHDDAVRVARAPAARCARSSPPPRRPVWRSAVGVAAVVGDDAGTRAEAADAGPMDQPSGRGGVLEVGPWPALAGAPPCRTTTAPTTGHGHEHEHDDGHDRRARPRARVPRGRPAPDRWPSRRRSRLTRTRAGGDRNVA